MEDWMNLEKLTLQFTNGIFVKSGEKYHSSSAS